MATLAERRAQSEESWRRHPGYGFCERCRMTWPDIKAHDTPISTGTKVFALCEECWAECAPTERLAFYRRLWFSWNRYADTAQELRENEELWENIKAAVMEGK